MVVEGGGAVAIVVRFGWSGLVGAEAGVVCDGSGCVVVS